MAILHVRNVPEELHKRLRQRAEGESRSLSAEVITLLQYALDQTEQVRFTWGGSCRAAPAASCLDPTFWYAR